VIAMRVTIPLGRDISLDGDLEVPIGARGLVIFAHGSGSSRRSPRNQFVARALQARGMATLLTDLLTAEEEAVDRRTAHLRFDIALLARRLVAIIDWSRKVPDLEALPIGLFGASTGAGAALVAAAHRGRDIAAIVSRGGRPDLAGSDLARVTAPTLLIVGGHDAPVIELNQSAAKAMLAQTAITIVPGASHLFEEPGALERVAELAASWFSDHLVPNAGPA
jgi:dienelactone hydrolase